MNDRLHRALALAAAAYLALQPTGAATFVKSCLFGLAVALALVVLLRAWRGRDEAPPLPPASVTAALLAWSAWSALTVFWSASPRYSLTQIERELGDAGLLVIAFYVAARDAAALRTILGGAVLSMMALGALAIGVDVLGPGWAPGRWHLGVGPWSTFLVLVAPLLPALVAGPPLGPRRSTGIALACVAIAILVVTGRMSESRMLWIALAVVFATAAACTAWRWRHSFLRAPARWTMPFAIAIAALGFLFADAARERAERNFPANTTVAATIAEDPRIPLWEHAGPKIRERLWTGHGFGRLILGDQFARDLGNPMLTHVHNLFLSQWVQSGAIGFALFCALLAALAVHYFRCLRADDDRRALIGAMGLALLAGFVVRNLTDDFLFRSNAKEFWLLNAAMIGGAQALARRRGTARGDRMHPASEAAPARAGVAQQPAREDALAR